MITDWDWTTLVASWRYYSGGSTIASHMFPQDLVSRYFHPKSHYDTNDRERIIRQFIEVDFPIKEHPKPTDDYNRLDKEWRIAHAFMTAWLNGFEAVTIKEHGKRNGKKHTLAVFRYGSRVIPVERYIYHPYLECYVPDDWIVPSKGNEIVEWEYGKIDLFKPIKLKGEA